MKPSSIRLVKVKEMSEKLPKFQSVHKVIEEMQERVDKLEKSLKPLRESKVTYPNHIAIKEENIKRLEKELEETKRSLEILKNLSWVKKA